jgi:tetratricopeptide (TPR) repeat protein
LFFAGRYTVAIAALNRYLELTGDRDRARLAAVYRARGEALAHLGDSAAAAEDFTRTLGMTPDDLAALVGRGWCYIVLDANALAESDFDRAVQLKPESASALLGRAYIRVKSGSAADGLRDAEAALRIGPREPQLLYNAARVFSRAAWRLESDPIKQGSSGWKERNQLESRALDLLREALQTTPTERQASFWNHQVEHDAALGPIKRSAAYRQMAGTIPGAGTPGESVR